jgi:chromosome segregation protein
MARLAGEQALLAASIQDTEFRLGDLRQAVQKIQSEAERLLERREQMGVQIGDLEQEQARLAAEIQLLGERRGALAAEREDKVGALGEARLRHAAGRARLEGLAAQLEASRAALAARRARLETLRLEQMRAAGARAERERGSGELRERGLQLERRAERLREELTLAEREAEELVSKRAHLMAAHGRASVQLSLLTSELAEIEAARAEQEGLRAQQRDSLAELRVRLAGRESEREALGRLEREREGYGAGVRAIFSERAAAELSGVIGTVADLLDVPSGLETAVEAVLGDRLQWVVVERFEQARAALGYLGREGAGAATLLSLETLPAPPAVPDDSPDLSWAARRIGGARPELVGYLLGRVGMVAHLDQAEALWRRNGVVATYVTPSGEVLAPVGRLTGGRRDTERQGNDQSILGRKRILRQLDEELVPLRREVSEAGQRLAALDIAVMRLSERQQTLRSSHQAQEAARLAGEKDVESLAREEDRVRRHLETLGVEIGALAVERDATLGELEDLDRALIEAREAEAALDRELRETGLALEAASETDAALLGEATACRVELATVAERVEALARDIDRLAELGREFGGQLEQAEVRRAQVIERTEDLRRERERTDAHARDAAGERDRLEAKLGAVAEEHRGQVGSREAFEAERTRAQQALGTGIRRLHELELLETEGRVRREELFEEARRRHGVESTDALAAANDPERDLGAARTRHEELGAKLESMGPVNLIADEEYRELEERHEFLRAQHDDVLASTKDLEKALKGMTRTAQERFQAAFDEINRHFGDIFTRLFEGGRAELRMVPPEEGDDDPLELGVELMAQPRGKRLQAVTLMSGGEKALTGLALLFAVFYYRPSPFCVLDEVDAPLDDANIHRFLRVLRELTSQTQFIVITHNRKTMDSADVLYGVTMEEPGLSRLVSVKLTEV